MNEVTAWEARTEINIAHPTMSRQALYELSDSLEDEIQSAVEAVLGRADKEMSERLAEIGRQRGVTITYEDVL